MSHTAEHINSRSSSEVNHKTVEAALADKLIGTEFGLGDISAKVISWADVKTIRLIQDHDGLYNGLHLEPIK